MELPIYIANAILSIMNIGIILYLFYVSINMEQVPQHIIVGVIIILYDLISILLSLKYYQLVNIKKKGMIAFLIINCLLLVILIMYVPLFMLMYIQDDNIENIMNSNNLKEFKAIQFKTIMDKEPTGSQRREQIEKYLQKLGYSKEQWSDKQFKSTLSIDIKNKI